MKSLSNIQFKIQSVIIAVVNDQSKKSYCRA